MARASANSAPKSPDVVADPVTIEQEPGALIRVAAVGSFILQDPYTRQVIEQTPPSDDWAGVPHTPFVKEQLELGQLVELD